MPAAAELTFAVSDDVSGARWCLDELNSIQKEQNIEDKRSFAEAAEMLRVIY